MKKRIAIGILVVLTIVIGSRMVPQMVESTIPSIYYVTPTVKTYENTVSCSGTVQSEMVQEIYLQSSLVAEEVLVSVGDLVREGDTLLTVDQAKTAAFSSSATGLVDNVLGSGAELAGLDLSSLLSAYGLTSLLGVDMNGVAEALGQGSQTVESTATSAEMVEVESEIISPVSGVVTEVNILPNMPASAGKAVFTIVDNTRYKVMVTVDEGDIAKINLGDEAKIRGVGFAGSSYRGTVSKIYPTARKALSGATADTVVDVEILLLNPDHNLKPGFTAKVEIAGGNHYDIITVPYEAIRQDENNDEYVYTYEDGKLHKTTVITGQELTNEVEILAGLDAGSVVIYNPDDIAREGTMIQIKGRADVN